MHRQAVADRQADHVGQVVLALGIVIVYAGQPIFKPASGCRQDAGVDFMDGAFVIRRVFMLDNALHLALAVAHDPAVSAWIA